jgi:hypothetical protein
VSFAAETTSGWQTQALPLPVDVVAGTSYVVSYSAPVGHYAFTDRGLASGVDAAPLHALPGDSTPGGNGVFGSLGQFPAQTYAGHSPNYWVDLLFTPTVQTLWSNTVVGGAESASSAAAEVGLRWASDTAGEVRSLRFWKTPGNAGPHVGHLWDDQGRLLATVTFVSETASGWQEQRLDAPVAVQASTPYVASYTAPAGHYAVTDQGLSDGAASGPLHALPGSSAGNGLVGAAGAFPVPSSGNANYWVDVGFAAAGSLPAPSGSRWTAGVLTSPIAILTNASYPQYGSYYPEILQAEGVNAFQSLELSAVHDLSGFQTVILPETTLTAAQVTLLTDWVRAGGVLIAMRPDPALTDLLGLGAQVGTVDDGYFLADPGRWGITGLPLQYHGAADLHPALPGTAVEAALYADATAPSGYPAVTVRSNVGPGHGSAIAFAFDLARSVVLTRQGNPALAGSRLLNADVSRSSELFYRAGSGPTQLDLARLTIPQADELQRLLVNLIDVTSGPTLPLPRFWYLPGGRKAAVLLSGDDHNVGGTPGVFETLAQAPYSPAGCSAADWTCARATSWIYTRLGLSASAIEAYRNLGFEVGPHLALNLDDGGCTQWTDIADLRARLTANQAAFVASYGVSPAATNRTHCFVFSDWDSEPKVERELGIRLDETYTPYAPSWTADQLGLLNGSAIPMRFTASDRSVIDVYQVVSNIDYEYFSGGNQNYDRFYAAFDALLSGATGEAGYWGIVGTHYDYSGSSVAELSALLDLVAHRNAGAATPADQVAMVSAQQVLTWLDLRNGSSFAVHGLDRTGVLSFGVRVNPAVANAGLEAMLPVSAGSRLLIDLRRSGGVAVPVKRTLSVKGVVYAFFDAVSDDQYLATYR